MAAVGLPADAPLIARWLYRFGTVPRGRAMERDFGPDDDPMIVLGLTAGGATRRVLDSDYEASALAGWYSFARAPARIQVRATCKLYVSPRPEVLADAFPVIAETFARGKVRSFKVGRGIEGLLRPDKIIAYFDDCAHLVETAALLGRALHDCPAQGVPFTADAGGDGLLSSGVDPEVGEVATSWRSWVTKRLAASITAHQAAPDGVDVVSTALEDLRRDGVDSDRWLPMVGGRETNVP